MEEVPFSDYGRALANLFRRIQECGLCDQNRQTLRRFADESIAQGTSQASAYRYTSNMKLVAHWLGKPFESAARQDVLRVVGHVETNGYSESTKAGIKVAIKKFFKWLRGTEDYPIEVRWIKASLRRGTRKIPEELITEEDARKMMEAAGNSRDRALIAVLFDSGCRIGEVGKLKVKHVQFDKFGAVIVVHGKTGMRRVRLVPSVPSLAQWMSFHPARSNPEAPLWVSFQDRFSVRCLTYPGARNMVYKLRRKAGIKKRIHPHLFRHSSATFWADKLTEAQMNERFGWVQGSAQSATYVHLSGRQVDDSILRTYGLKRDEDNDGPKFVPRECLRCHTQNETTAKFCASCGMAFDPIAATERDKELETWNARMNKLIRDPEVQSLLLSKLQELDRSGSAPSA